MSTHCSQTHIFRQKKAKVHLEYTQLGRRGARKGGECHFKLVSEKDACPPSADPSKLNKSSVK